MTGRGGDDGEGSHARNGTIEVSGEDPRIDAKAKKNPHGTGPRGYCVWIELDYLLETNTRFDVEVV